MCIRDRDIRPRTRIWAIFVILGLTPAGSVLFDTHTEGHPFYVSVSQIRFNSVVRTLEISLKIFTDDFELALEEASNQRLRLGSPREHPKADDFIRSYLKENFQIRINDTRIDLNYLGKEAEIDATWCYLESERLPPAPGPGPGRAEEKAVSLPLRGEVTVTNRILLEVFENQTNIVHIEIGGEKRSLLLSRVSETDSVRF